MSENRNRGNEPARTQSASEQKGLRSGGDSAPPGESSASDRDRATPANIRPSDQADGAGDAEADAAIDDSSEG